MASESESDIEYLPDEDDDDGHVAHHQPMVLPKDEGVADVNAAADVSASLVLANAETERVRAFLGYDCAGDDADAGVSPPRGDMEVDDDVKPGLDEPPLLYVPLRESAREKMEDKMTFLCECCDKVLNSYDTMVSHAQGIRHQETLSQLQQLDDLASLFAAAGPADRPRIIQIRNPEPMRKKVPVRLQAKLKETTQPAVGLACVDEFLPVYNDELEPYYQCNLCTSIGEANGMFNHVLNYGHQQKFFMTKFPDRAEFVDLPRPIMKKAAERFRDNDRLHLVNSYHSDLMFPWPAGKAPWSVEQGGDGIVPASARENIDREHTLHPIWKALRENQSRAMAALKGNVPNPGLLRDVKDAGEAELYCDFARQLLARLVEFEPAAPPEGQGDRKTAQLDKAILERSNAVQLMLLGLPLMVEEEEEVRERGKGAGGREPEPRGKKPKSRHR